MQIRIVDSYCFEGKSDSGTLGVLLVLLHEHGEHGLGGGLRRELREVVEERRDLGDDLHLVGLAVVRVAVLDLGIVVLGAVVHVLQEEGEEVLQLLLVVHTELRVIALDHAL